MTNNAPSGTKKHCKSIELESHQTAKMFFFDVEICRVGLYTELYYAYYVSMLFADLLSLHLVTFLCFFYFLFLYISCLQYSGSRVQGPGGNSY